MKIDNFNFATLLIGSHLAEKSFIKFFVIFEEKIGKVKKKENNMTDQSY